MECTPRSFSTLTEEIQSLKCTIKKSWIEKAQKFQRVSCLKLKQSGLFIAGLLGALINGAKHVMCITI